MIMTRMIKIRDVFFLKSGSPEKGQLWRKLRPWPPDFSPTTSQHVAQRSQERDCSFHDYTVHVFRGLSATAG